LPGDNAVAVHHLIGMDATPDRDIDAALVAACFEQISTRGWAQLSIALAARNIAANHVIRQLALELSVDLVRVRQITC